MRRLLAFFRPALVLLLVMSAQFQVGLMPAQAADGQVVMVICAGDGPMILVLDPETGTFHPAPSGTMTSDCSWAVQGLALLPEPGLPPRALRVTALAPVIEADLWRPAHDPRGIWARGPPRLV